MGRLERISAREPPLYPRQNKPTEAARPQKETEHTPFPLNRLF